jgi:hypothetical protein
MRLGGKTMKTLPLVLAVAALGCTPATHHAVSALDDCVDPPPGTDAAVPLECRDAPTHDESGAWVNCLTAWEARPNDPCSFGEGGHCGGGTGSAHTASVTCGNGRIFRYDETNSAAGGVCTETATEVVGDCLEIACLSICPGEATPPVDTTVTWDIDDETSCRALLAELPEAGEPCTGEGWCQGFHLWETEDDGQYLGDWFLAFCGDSGLAIMRHDPVDGRPTYFPE